MTFALFWIPVFRGWMTALPVIVVGLGGVYLQLRRLRVEIDATVAQHKADLAAEVQRQLDQQTAVLTKEIE